ncbi:hypothetical protein I4F81_007253 [Pyropia yezoensis]|uniref:Uncharacterized protein n=1 Tax=Pyropia yezoensis TaxID=2788 RepID=A0ACC3C306_PYRYE|nr:hypothetical protein I4F81_007253 [Neopyropia yezoensis]
MLTGALVGAVTAPLDVLAASSLASAGVAGGGGGSAGAAAAAAGWRSVVATRGVGGLFGGARGFGGKVAWEAANSGIFFVVYEALMGLGEEDEGPPQSTGVALLLSCLSSPPAPIYGGGHAAVASGREAAPPPAPALGPVDAAARSMPPQVCQRWAACGLPWAEVVASGAGTLGGVTRGELFVRSVRCTSCCQVSALRRVDSISLTHEALTAAAWELGSAAP